MAPNPFHTCTPPGLAFTRYSHYTCCMVHIAITGGRGWENIVRKSVGDEGGEWGGVSEQRGCLRRI